jgi:hypothetical protein
MNEKDGCNGFEGLGGVMGSSTTQQQNQLDSPYVCRLNGVTGVFCIGVILFAVSNF